MNDDLIVFNGVKTAILARLDALRTRAVDMELSRMPSPHSLRLSEMYRVLSELEEMEMPYVNTY